MQLLHLNQDGDIVLKILQVICCRFYNENIVWVTDNLETRNSGIKTAERAKEGKLQCVDQSLLSPTDCKKLCK